MLRDVGDARRKLVERARMGQATWRCRAPGSCSINFAPSSVRLERPAVKLQVHCNSYLVHPFGDSFPAPDGVRSILSERAARRQGKQRTATKLFFPLWLTGHPLRVGGCRRRQCGLARAEGVC